MSEAEVITDYDLDRTKNVRLVTIPNLKTLTTDELWSGLRDSLSITANAIRRAAAFWVELQERGEDMSSITTPFLSLLPIIHAGRLSPELAVRFGHDPRFLENVSHLTQEDQARILDPKALIEVVSVNRFGKFETRKARPIDLRLSEVALVFGDGHIRTVAEQRRQLRPIKLQKEIRAESVRRAVDFDLSNVLSDDQQSQLATLAKKAKTTPAQFVADLLIQNRIIKQY